MKHNFHERKANRIDHAKKQAKKNEELSDSLFEKASKMASIVPMGQPILVGHHSEKSDRNYRNKIHNTFGKAFEAEDKAKYYHDKAETIESNDAISSDDPEALAKLKDKLASLQKSQDFMKAANQCLRKKDKEGFLKLEMATEGMWGELNCPNNFGFPHYKFSNNSAEIRRIKDRIVQLQKIQALETKEIRIGDSTIVINVEAKPCADFIQFYSTGGNAKKTEIKWVQMVSNPWCMAAAYYQLCHLYRKTITHRLIN